MSIEYPPIHNDTLSAPEWVYWFTSMMAGLPRLTADESYKTGTGITYVYATTWTDLFSITISDNYPGAILSVGVIDAISLRVNVNGNTVATYSGYNLLKRMGSILWPLSSLAKNDVVAVQGYVTADKSIYYNYSIEYIADGVTAGQRGHPAQRYENNDSRWYGYFLGIKKEIEDTESLVFGYPKTLNTSITRKSTGTFSQFTIITVASLTVNANGILVIKWLGSIDAPGWVELYRDGVEIKQTENNNILLSLYDIQSGSHTYEVKVWILAGGTLTYNGALLIYT